MNTVKTVRELRAAVARARGEGKRIGFVPTMGNLHSGHAALVIKAAQRADFVVASIFVNPLQFGPGEDFQTYPRTLEEDLARLADERCALVFAPSEQTMYPGGRDAATRVEVPALGDILCGVARPGHFEGVATVVARLFNLVQPDCAVFGEKDYQQLLVVRRMNRDLCFPVEIVGVPTQRAPDGLAMSSRNRYLDTRQRAAAPALYAALGTAAKALEAGSRDIVALQHSGMENVRSAGLEPEYFEIRRQEDLARPAVADRRLVVLAAARLGRTRLIDNLPVELD